MFNDYKKRWSKMFFLTENTLNQSVGFDKVLNMQKCEKKLMQFVV